MVWPCLVVQAAQFGTSPFLQASDFQAKSDVSNISSSYIHSTTTLTVNLNSAARAALTPLTGTQFRLRFSDASFTNWNGA